MSSILHALLAAALSPILLAGGSLEDLRASDAHGAAADSLDSGSTDVTITAVPEGSLRVSVTPRIELGNGTVSNPQEWQGSNDIRVWDDRLPGITGWTMTAKMTDAVSATGAVPASSFDSWVPGGPITTTAGVATGTWPVYFPGPDVPMPIASLRGTGGLPSETYVRQIISVPRSAVPLGEYRATLTIAVL